MKIHLLITLGILCLISGESSAQVSSTFDTDADGWTFFSSTTPITINYQGINGNPGGYVSATYSSNISTAIQSWIAPAKFLGSKVLRSLGMNLRFDIRQSQTGTSSASSGDVRIESGGLILVYSLPAKPQMAPSWSSYQLKLDETQGWRIGSTTGSLATRTQIIAALSNLTSIEIRGTYATSTTYTSGIDNVVLEQRTLQAAPTITSFTPTSATPGASVVITGANFGNSIANNIVYFGSIAGTITNAVTTQLTVTVPVGATYASLSVTNKTTGLSTQSAKPFNPLFAGGGRIIPASFEPRFDIILDPSIGTELNGLKVADLDGDGWNDLVVSERVINDVSIFRNLALGGDLTTASFAPKFSLTGAGNNPGLMIIDLDGDGKLDIISAYESGAFVNDFATFRNISTPGNLVFEPVELWAGLVYSGFLSNIVDVDGDGLPDLIGQHGAGSTSPDFWIAQNISTQGNIEFGNSVSYFGSSTLDAGAGVSVGDLDNDGKPEMVVKYNFGGSFAILKNNSTPGIISFDTPIVFSGTVRGSVNIADFNLDGKNDLAWKHGFSNDDIKIRINTNSGGPIAASDFATEIILDSDLGNYGGMSIADVNGDGKPDILATDDADFGVFENKYEGGPFLASSFARAHQLEGGGATTYPTSIIAADLNGDAKPEIIFGTSNTNPPRVAIIQNNNLHTPVISLNTISPLKGVVGSTVTITGSNFSTVTTENNVWFGSVRATVLTSTFNEITVQVPAGAVYERISVTRDFLTARYHLPYTVVFSAGPVFTASSFLPPVSYALTGADYDVEVADLNADGKPEIIAESRIVTSLIRNYGLSYKNIHASGAIGTTSFILDDTTSTSAQDLKLVDVDADGKPDIVSFQGIYRNTSSASEIAFDPINSNGAASNHSVADYNLDGKTDMVGVTYSSGSALVFENRSPRPGPFTTGTFSTLSPSISFAKPDLGGGTATADFDNDGLSEFVSTSPSTDNLRVWRNTGGYRINVSQFVVVGDIATGDNPGRIYTGDLDVDGKMDLVVYHGTGVNNTMISVFHNQSTTGSIIFNRVNFTIPAAATVAHISDINGDGKPEILVTSESTDQFFILRNTASPGVINASSFAAAFATPVTNPRGLTSGDLNLDGKPEIIITSAPNSLLIFENVVPTPLISVITQPTSLLNLCEGASAIFSVVATGTSDLSYQWQKLNGSTYNNIVEGGGYTGVTSAMLTINTAGNFGAGDYRCQISSAVAPQVFSSSATLTISSVPLAPTASGAIGCGSSTLLLNAAGGVNGQYRWYATPLGTISIAGEVNNTYTTPLLAATTDYYVAINNGTCESERTIVTAQINNVPIAPITTGITGCQDSTVILNASGGSDGQYKWYTQASGGTALSGEVNSAFSIALNTTTTYFVSIDNGICESARTSATATITLPPGKPNIAISGSTALCTGESVALSAPVDLGLTYLWSNGEATQQIIVSNAGTYSLETISNGCTSISSDPITVAITNCNEPPVIATASLQASVNGSASLKIGELISDPDNNIDLTTLRIIQFPESGASATIDSDFNLLLDYKNISFIGFDEITIEVCDLTGVCVQQKIIIEVVGELTIYNAISPNGDNKNDSFKIEYVDVLLKTKNNKVSIFSRWGDLVWEGLNYDNSATVFTGMNKNGNQLPSGIYYYKIEFSSGKETLSGYLTLKY